MTDTRPALLFVHGIHAGAWFFERWLSWFRDRGHRTVAVDLRGHGDAPLPPATRLGAVRFRDYVDDAARAAAPLGRPVVVGHSMGGLVAQALAERGLVSAAVLVSPAPPRWITVLTPQLLRYQIRDLPAVLASRTLHPSWPAMRDLALNRVPEGERRALFDRLGPESGTVAGQLSLTGVPIDARRVRCPLLVLSGDDDRYVPLGKARRVAAKYGAPLRVLPGRGHAMMQEPGWEEGAEAIARWMGARGPGTGD
ncbi:MAG TPA: alpha/beta fold hydrolase [Gemmatimonadaceae bacterium]|nr:alpha/beta fold hydrolase [Gemmatimonadaceae bacterium]